MAIPSSELAEVALDLTQLCLDLAGIADPTPISDGSSALISLGRGRWFDAIISGVSMLPYVGDLAKAGKLPRYVKTVEKAIQLAEKSKDAARLLAPVIARLDEALRLMPNVPSLQPLRQAVRRFLRQNRAATHVAAALPDIRKHFQFRKFSRGSYDYVEASGRLGVPGKVRTFRSQYAQSKLAGGTGDHAGHLIGSRFGPQADGLNLGLQNANINTRAPRVQQHWAGKGGNYLELENDWARKLESGIGIEVKVTDVYKAGEARPFVRKVEWTEIGPTGAREKYSLDFANTTSPQSRAKQ
ncbi:MAG: DNA/RNA non-specific endonuclease [Acidobacteria bacterium]|nr:DNA/RNA non-specific endonuclease [Acidobacteriota bacterium]